MSHRGLKVTWRPFMWTLVKQKNGGLWRRPLCSPIVMHQCSIIIIIIFSIWNYIVPRDCFFSLKSFHMCMLCTLWMCEWVHVTSQMCTYGRRVSAWTRTADVTLWMSVRARARARECDVVFMCCTVKNYSQIVNCTSVRVNSIIYILFKWRRKSKESYLEIKIFLCFVITEWWKLF